MANVAVSWYGPAFLSAFNKEIDFEADDIRVMLLGAGYVPNLDTHRYKSSLSDEIVATGYTAGGAVLGTPSMNFDGGLNQFVLSGDDVSWPGSEIEDARYGVVYDRTPATDATRPLLVLIDFGTLISSVETAFQILWDADGVSRVTVIS